MIRTLSVFGDSISTFENCIPSENAVFYEGERCENSGVLSVEQTWWSIFAQLIGARIVANASYSGSMVEGAGFPAGTSPKRWAQLLGADGEVPSDVLVFMGTNDYGWGSARAQAAGRSAATPGCVDLSEVPQGVAGLAEAGALERFEVAYVEMLQGIKATCPGAKVWVLTLLAGQILGAAGPAFCLNLRGIPMDEYNQAIKRAAQLCDCGVLDVFDCGFDYEAIDGTHPTELGMKQLAYMAYAKWAQDAGVISGNSDLFDSQFKSASACCCEVGVGCKYAESTGNAWTCVCQKGLA